MRVFIGITLNNESKDKIQEIQNKYLRDFKITDKDNLHLTLVFLGEVEENRLYDIKEVIESIDVSNIEIYINKIESMRSLVIGKVNPSKNLINYQKELATKLKVKGFNIEDRKYFPHITLARKSNININLDVEIKESSTEVVLFESILDKTKANYIEKYKKHID